MTAPRDPRRRASYAVGALLLSASLLAGCSSSPPPPPDAEEIPTLPAKPTAKAQPKPTIQDDAARTEVLNGLSSATADAAWQQSLDLVRNWLYAPKLMQYHPVTKATELDGITKIMTASAGERWRQVTHKALSKRVDTHGRWDNAQLQLEFPIYQLVVWNMRLRSDRGWDNPMLTPVKVTDGFVAYANGQIGCILHISTKYRMIGQGKEYRTPTSSYLGLTWIREDGQLKLNDWWRVGSVSPEFTRGWRPGQAPPAAPITPGAEVEEPGGKPTADPSLYPE